jgi:hypothetical protein
MANLNSDRYNKAPCKPMAGILGVNYGSLSIAAAQSKDDTITWFYIPQGVIVIDGWLRGDDIDTGTEAYELDIGVSDDTDKYLNSGVITGDAVTGVKPVGVLTRLNQNTVAASSADAMPDATTEEEQILGTVVAAANSGGTGELGLWFEYTGA